MHNISPSSLISRAHRQVHLPVSRGALVKGEQKLLAHTFAWQMQRDGRLALDAYDQPDSSYLLLDNATARLSGFVRLLPTTQPYPLARPGHPCLQGMAPPCMADVWELSRLTVIDRSEASACGTASSWPHDPAAGHEALVIELFHGALAWAARRRVSRLITLVSHLSERMLCGAGFQAHRFGPPAIVDGKPMLACWIETGHPPPP
jgi:acyl homoserine lactone synthase